MPPVFSLEPRAHTTLGTSAGIIGSPQVLGGRARLNRAAKYAIAAGAPLAGALFVYVVILAGPLVGLALSRWRPRAGAWIVAASMGGALVFGLVNHFLIAGSDHVMHVAAEWRTLFGVTAALLVLSEAIGVGTGLWCATRSPRTTGRIS